jgi:O-antigen/teichoic acid export membrane protein
MTDVAPAPPVASQPPDSGAYRAMKNSMYAIVEFAWPIALSLVVTPIVVRGLGADAYGVLALVAVTLGLFGLLDLGIGGAAIRAVAQHHGQGDLESAGRVIGTVVTAYLVIGVAGGIAVAAATPFLVSTFLAIPADLQPAATIAFYASAVGFPISLLVGAFASIPKAVQRFDRSTRVAVVFSTIGPVMTAALVVAGLGIPAIAVGSLVMNVAALIVYYRVGRGLLGGAPIPLGIDRGLFRELAMFGGWFLVASVGIAMLYQVDKLLIGALIGVAAVTYYVVPGNLANRIQGFLGAATQVVFPASSALLAAGRHDAMARLYRDGTRLTFLLAMTLGVPMAVFAAPFLRYWLGAEFAAESATVMVVLVATYVLLGLTGVVWGLAFGAGHARTNALFAVGMGTIDIVLLLVLVGPYGIVGAAIAYLVSAALGVPALIWTIERRVVRLRGHEFIRQYARVLPAVALQVVIAFLLLQVAAGLLLTLVAMAATAAVLPVLYLLLGLATPGDRELLGQLIARLRQRRLPG